VLAGNGICVSKKLEPASELGRLNNPNGLFVCAMDLDAKKRGIKPRGLHNAVVDERQEKLLESDQSHRALADVIFVLEVLRATVKA